MKYQLLRVALLAALCLAIPQFALAIFDRPAVVTFTDAAGNPQIYVFATGQGGDLVVDHWDGSGPKWTWSNHHQPAGLNNDPQRISAATCKDGSGYQHIYAFTHAEDNLGQIHLVVRYNFKSRWYWADLGVPPNLPYPSLSQDDNTTTAALCFTDANGNIRVYGFASASNGHLVVAYGDGATWQWADQGLPGGVSNLYKLSAVTFQDGRGRQQLYIFGDSDIGHLVVNYWDGSQWRWADQGVPAGLVGSSEPSAIWFPGTGGSRMIYVFCIGSNGHMVVNYRIGSSWAWADNGLPAGKSQLLSTSATAYLDTQGARRIFAFSTTPVNGVPESLVVNFWNGSTWAWSDLGLPPGQSSIFGLAAITFANVNAGGIVDCFLQDGSNHLEESYLFANNWTWIDLGMQ